ncbi:hypothetical protein ACQEUU_37025 [Nonomuraea sp. CA-218870]|uniref:hypothetical protein n=1 Tax=Nonomuraea sp. CA-218870 TaxID=3239998 RepID=UPI003D903B82
MTDISPERIAAHLYGSEVRDEVRRIGWVDVASEGNVLRIEFTPKGKPGHTQHFRAVVVPADAGPVVVASPTLLAAARALYRVHVISAALPAEESVQLIHELGDALEALTPEQVAVLAGDEQDGDGDV